MAVISINGEQQPIVNKPARGVSYYTPAQTVPAGKAYDPQSDGTKPPKLFQDLKIRGLTFHNRIFLSPLCQYSAQNGYLTDWHLSHLGGIIQRGPGLTFVEDTAVTPEGRITPEDSGLWEVRQMIPLKRIVEFAHGQNQLIGIQIGHAGRKASTTAPWLGGSGIAEEAAGGWPYETLAPSPVATSDEFPSPNELTIDGIEEIVRAFVQTAKRAVECGFDVIEIHGAHGFLLHQFLSPVVNQRTDQYGGCFENRVRLMLDTVKAIRAAIPDKMPLFLRISASDCLEDLAEQLPASWTLDQSVRLAPLLAAAGVDLLDVSTGGIHPKQSIQPGPGYQVPFAKAIKDKVRGSMAVATVGAITNGPQAQKILIENDLDVVMIGRAFLKNPVRLSKRNPLSILLSLTSSPGRCLGLCRGARSRDQRCKSNSVGVRW
jgi:2,4-dienoyl-CoA reductase-like NADH-dependent reductase (Old Yellow Enzyme family)